MNTYNSTLTSRADTYLELYNQDGITLLKSNDNSVGQASSVSFFPSSTGNYYLKVFPSPNRPASNGRYGTYYIQVTSP